MIQQADPESQDIAPASPRAFLMSRRPERFSDSIVDESTALDRSLLEYHLDTLTSRSQETEFARFAHRLAELEVCPNLLPQTGPTGGGDSKADAETYPVAESLAMAWFVGEGTAARERWAFAFSAMKKWQPKVKSDVAKIAATGRGYSKIFFITNQYVPDKKRAQVEDTLTKAYKIDVRILDRTWILDRVFAGRREALAIETLGLTADIRRQVRLGPRDTERLQALETVEHRIAEALQQNRLSLALVDNALEAAELGRSLDRPRTEVDGRFARAARLAAQCGTPHQELRVAYEHAWTLYFWFEDADAFLALYPKIEALALESRNAYELELLTNLWLVLKTAVDHGRLDALRASVDARRRALEQSLQRLASDGERRSSALQARMGLLLIRLATSSHATVSDGVRKLGEVVEQAEGLVGFPFEPLVQILTELGNTLAGDPVVDEVFDKLVAAVERREGALRAARMYLRRGVQQLEHDRPYDAIRTLGRALVGLHTHESRHEMALALAVCASAYERVGLLWAARGTLLSAVSIAMNDFWTYQDVTPRQARMCAHLKRIELQLGRLGHVLAWHELDAALRGVLEANGAVHDAEPTRESEDDWMFDWVLGMLFLRADLWELKSLAGLPGTLEGELKLPRAAIALQYALGHEELVPDELLVPVADAEPAELPDANARVTDSHPVDATASDASLLDAGVLTEPSAGGLERPTARADALLHVFRRWRDQPAAEHLPASLVLGEGTTVRLSTSVLGCRITVDATNRAPMVELAESCLAAIEALLATGTGVNLVATEPTVTIRIRPSDLADSPFTFERQLVDGRPAWEVRCRAFDPFHLPADAQRAIQSRIWELLVDVMAHAFVPRRMSDLESLFRDERAHERALNFTGSFVTLGNVLGETPRTSVADWVAGNTSTYPLRRTRVWDADDRDGARATVRPAPVVKNGELPPPNLVEEVRAVKHSEMATVSLIRGPLWNEAGWFATAFAEVPGANSLPILAFVFRDGRAATAIGRGLRAELGAEDRDDALRIAIIRRISRRAPHAYRVVVGSNPEAYAQSAGSAKNAAFMARILEVEPATSANLERFLAAVDRAGAYDVTVAVSNAEQSDYALADALRITKRTITVREAWEIGLHDLDAMAIDPDDDPVIPEGRTDDAPVLGLLARLRREQSVS